jgi:hypothetical protein
MIWDAYMPVIKIKTAAYLLTVNKFRVNPFLEKIFFTIRLVLVDIFVCYLSFTQRFRCTVDE